MKWEDRDRLDRETVNHHYVLRFRMGIEKIWNDPNIRFCFGLMVGLIVLICILRPWDILIPGDDFFADWKRTGIRNLFYIGSVICILGCVIMIGTPFRWRSIQNALQRTGLVNHAGEAPYPIRIWQDPEHERMTVLEFESVGISLSEWEDCRERIEAALNVIVAEIREGREKRRILLYTVPVLSMLPDFLPWKEEYRSDQDFELLLGESLLGSVSVNLAKIPHILIGGSTGSGKSVLLKLILMQCAEKGAAVYIADFKGGVDFPPVWYESCHFILDQEKLIRVLTDLVMQLETRKLLFRETGCANLEQYNEQFPEKRKRIIFACDEVAELLNKTGLSKAEKEQAFQIENKLSILARQGRAFGIHLILATQRPDATILTGQIRSNLDCRICGRADQVLSQIILDSTEAAERIPKDSQGRFLLSDGTLFQSYWFDETTWKM